MWSFIQENIIGLLGVLVAAVIPLVVYFRQKNRKELSYEILSSTSLLIHDESLKNRLKLTIDDQEIQDDVYLVLVKILNTGNQPVKSTDFEQAITIDTRESRYGIAIAELKEQKPNNLGVTIENSHSIVKSVKPLLLNPKDEFTLKLLIQGYKDDLEITSRIVGGQLTKYKKSIPMSLVFFSISIIVIPSLLVYIITNAFFERSTAINISGAMLAATCVGCLPNLLSYIKRNLLKN